MQLANPDKLAGVFDRVWDGYTLKNLGNVLCCYPNQLEDGEIELPDDFSDGEIVILDMWALRKWDIKIIAWKDSNMPEWIQHPVLLSPGVVEYYESERWEKYVQTVLRDGGKMNSSKGITNLADANERTTTAGRNFTGDLFEDLEVENAEESPFLMQDEAGKYCLVMHDLHYKKALIDSIKNFLEKKYATEEDDNYEEIKASFERKFKGVTYEELWAILTTIIENDSFLEYDWTDGAIEGIDMETVELDGEKGDFYVYHDEVNNTIEYRAIRRITGFPEGLKAIGRVPLRLFLESQNQDPSFKNIKNISKYGAGEIGLVPTMADFAQRVSDTM